MKGVSFILAVHNHQPVGNRPEVIEKIYRAAYLPFVETLEELPGANVALHYSGGLIEWFVEAHPEFLDRIRGLVRHGQVEILAGGYYEPILAIQPDEDKVEQIRAFANRLRECFGVDPTGYWLTERAWEPHLAKFICDAGMRYTFLDDAIFHGAGLREPAMFQCYLTEEQGRSLIVFPIPKRLRYLIPFEEPEETFAYLRSVTAPRKEVAVLADDGEKFGAWPGTYEVVYGTKKGQGWLHRFAALIEEQGMRMVTPSEYLRQSSACRHVYLPTASYSELMEWTLPVELSEEYQETQKLLRAPYAAFLRGGYWRNFLTKYEAAHHLYRKMLYVATKVHGMHGPGKAAAKQELWKGQCNDAYWHGVFGGLYLGHLRAAAYWHLIRAEKLADAELHAPAREWLELDETDFDGDLKHEILVNTHLMNAYFTPWRGGTLVEWDFKPVELNLLDTLTRRPEVYHQELVKTQKLKQTERDNQKAKSIHDIARAKDEILLRYLTYDAYRRVSFIDHFLPPATRMQEFQQGSFEELGDFVEQPYGYETLLSGTSVLITLTRRGSITINGTAIPLRVTKTITVAKDRPDLRLAYQIENSGTQGFRALFGTELNLSPAFARSSSHSPHAGIDSFELANPTAGVGLRVTATIPMSIWRIPVYTVSQSEKGFERGLQGCCVLPLWLLELEPGSHWNVELSYNLSEL